MSVVLVKGAGLTALEGEGVCIPEQISVQVKQGKVPQKAPTLPLCFTHSLQGSHKGETGAQAP